MISHKTRYLILTGILMLNPLAARVPLSDIHSLFPKPPLQNSEPVSKDKIIQELRELSLEEIKELYFYLFETHMPESVENQATTIDKKFLEKIELPDLLKHIDHTQTGIGYVCLAKRLASPLHNAAELQKRQDILKVLLDNDNLFELLKECLQEIASVENTALNYYASQDDALKEETFNKLYFSNKFSFLNSSQYALECSTRVRNILNGLLAIQIPATYALIDGVMFGIQSKSITQGLKLTGQRLFNWVNPQRNSLIDCTPEDLAAHRNLLKSEFSKSMGDKSYHLESAILSTLPKSLGDSFFFLKHGTNPERAIHSVALIGLYLWTSYLIKKNYTEFKFDTDIVKHLQQQLIAVAKYVNTMRFIYEQIKEHPALNTTEEFTALENLFGEHSESSQKLLKLTNLLNSTTFSGSPSVFSLAGKVLAAHTLMKEVKNELLVAYQAIGILDTYVSSVELMKKHTDTPVSYTFPTYLEAQDEPLINVKNSWNPFIAAEKSVPNTIQLGFPSPRNIIITGPNTGGKTTTIKSILLDILMGQTLGIAAADSIEFTPFATINCYLNITDDLNAGTSLFKAEVLRAKNLINSVRNLEKNEFSFTIVDEVFSGTSPEEGQKAAFRFIKEMGNFDNSICLCATHFAKLTELPEENAVFKNYCVTMHKDEFGNWIRPFTLDEGCSSLNIAMELLEEEGVFESFSKTSV